MTMEPKAAAASPADAAEINSENLQSVKPRAKSARWRKLAAALLVGVIIAAAFLPQILSSSLVRGPLTATLLENFDGEVEIGTADLAWWKAPEISHLVMKNRDGQPIVQIGNATIANPLWQMLFPRQQPLEVTIRNPQIYYEIDQYGQANWDRVFHSMKPPADSSHPSGMPFQHHTQPINFRIVDGEVILKDHVSERTIRAGQIQAQLKKSQQFLEGTLQAETALQAENDQSQPAGNIQSKFQLAFQDQQVTAGDVTAEISQTPLELLQPWLKKFVPHLNLKTGLSNGSFSSQWTGNWKTGIKLAVNGTLNASQLEATSTKWWPDFNLKSSELTGKFSIDNTLPTAPGTFDLDCQLTDANLLPISGLQPPFPEASSPTDKPEPLKFLLELGDVKLQTRGEINVPQQRIDLAKLEWNSKPWQGTMQGSLSQFASSTPFLDFEGNTTGNVLPFLYVAFPNLVLDVSGQDFAPDQFAIRGVIPNQFFSKSATTRAQVPTESATVPAATTSADAATAAPVPDAKRNPFDEQQAAGEPFSAVATWKWKQLDAYGVRSSQGGLWTRFADRQLRIVPVDLQIGQRGLFLAKADVDFRLPEPILSVEEGYVLKDVEFTETMCRSWLKYIAPVFAEATDLEGTFSLSVRPSQINLKTGLAEQLAGTLQVVECRLGPGPMIQQATAPIQGIAGLVNRGQPGLFQEGAKWIELPAQDVLFKKDRGRFYHQDLTFQSGKVSIISQGSVGDDQTLDLSLLIPINFVQDKSRPIAQILDQPIPIHIGGTLAEPKVDAQGLANFGKQFGVNALDSLLQGIFDRRRNRR